MSEFIQNQGTYFGEFLKDALIGLLFLVLALILIVWNSKEKK